MNRSRINDIILNTFIPILIGSAFYFAEPNQLIRNYLPDGLWAYSLISTILIIWNRQINMFWILFSFFLFILFELLQKINIIRGTGDIYDVAIYFVFGFTSIITNKIFKLKLNYYEEKY